MTYVRHHCHPDSAISLKNIKGSVVDFTSNIPKLISAKILSSLIIISQIKSLHKTYNMPEAVPILFTVNGATRHELMLISPTHATLDGISAEMISLASSSPNCAEFMSKYKKPGEEGVEAAVEEIKVRWNAQSHDPKIFPASTIVTKDNFKAIVTMIGMSGVGRDVLEVKLESK